MLSSRVDQISVVSRNKSLQWEGSTAPLSKALDSPQSLPRSTLSVPKEEDIISSQDKLNRRQTGTKSDLDPLTKLELQDAVALAGSSSWSNAAEYRWA